LFYSKNTILKIKYFFFCLIFYFKSQAQLIKNIQLEIVGKPTWQMVLPLENQGLMLFAKSDLSKAKVYMFDNELNKLWETDVYLDVERQPTAYTFSETKATFLFRENQGMYYQLFIFDIATGKYQIKGFELREYFNDQNYVFFENRILMAGSNTDGGVFYEYNFESEIGKFINTDIKGQVECQEFVYNKQKNTIESLWAIKTQGFTNEKKKTGTYIKDAFLTIADFDTTGKLLNAIKISQKSGKFPISGKILKLNDDNNLVVGTYKASSGDKGLFISAIKDSTTNQNLVFYSFSKLIGKTTETTETETNKLLNNYSFLMHKPLINQQTISIGGVFYKSQIKTVSEQAFDQNRSNSLFDNGRNNPFSRTNSRTQTKNVFAGYSYTNGIMVNLDFSGQIIDNQVVNINQSSYQLQQNMAFNNAGAAAYCIKGNLAAKNFLIGSKPVLYKLTDEEVTLKNKNFLPSYNEVRHWYDNYFIADGSKTKIEAISLNSMKDTSNKRRKKNKPPVYTQIRKTIFITKIASGR
jgi:hypothetical protein